MDLFFILELEQISSRRLQATKPAQALKQKSQNCGSNRFFLFCVSISTLK
jgi:DNA phosphorothioation-dependent restriction protein DptG